ncbi:hypothetical protein ILUMI_12624 [Ignelater luminosus]|uniref:Uncharacterized protein n=1 Tax=Ignelater luminosus TaxID=2038154 RepID=A0A8K0G6L3_IGNLU|nr:hypothetical protein ILUMI_12624 [Ignelater luminosus]
MNTKIIIVCTLLVLSCLLMVNAVPAAADGQITEERGGRYARQSCGGFGCSRSCRGRGYKGGWCIGGICSCF